MSRRLAAAVVTAAMAVLAAPAASAGPVEARTTSGGSATTVCTNVSGCRVVASADIDGDGRTDQVGIVDGYVDGVEGYVPKGRSTIRVRTAKGRTLTSSTTGITWYSRSAYFGVASIDGKPGREIVVGTKRGSLLGDIGASGSSASRRGDWTEFRVITYRNGALTTLRSPAGDSTSGSYRWRVYEGEYPAIGFSRVTSNGSVYLRRSVAQPKAYPSTAWTRSTTSYRWNGSGWTKGSTSKSTITRATGLKTAWLRLSGLPSYTGCGNIIFTPQSDDMALAIGGVGLSCTTAKSVVRAADHASWHASMATVKGYRCTVYGDDSGMRHSMVTCRSGRQMIAWRRF